jgi:hypothetical protein
MGVNSNLGKGFTFNGYFDLFRFPWLRSLVDAPSGGHEYLLRLDYAPGYKWGFYAQYRMENKQSNLSDNTSPIDYLIFKRRQNLRLPLVKNEDLFSCVCVSDTSLLLRRCLL